MNNNILDAKTYTPIEVAEILKINKNTVYELIKKGEIVAKRIGNVYRIPAKSIAFVFTGLDYDIYESEQNDLKNLKSLENVITKVRKETYGDE